MSMTNAVRFARTESVGGCLISRLRTFASLAVLAVLALSALSCSTASRSLHAEEPVSTIIDIIIKGSAYHVQSGFLKLGEPAMIHLTNADPITHGFEWTSVEWDEVRIETEGLTTFTRGNFTRLHLQPGQSVRIRFTPVRSGVIRFKCDLHPGMEGEIFVLKLGLA